MIITKEKVIEFGAWLTGHDEETVAELLDDYNHYKERKVSVPAETLVSGILADFENLLIDVMGSRKCSIGSLENYYELHLEVKRINELYSKIQEYQIVSQNSR